MTEEDARDDQQAAGSPAGDAGGAAPAPAPPPTAPRPVEERQPAAPRADVFEPGRLPVLVLRILKDPQGGLAKCHVAGRGAFLNGFVLGVAGVFGISFLGIVMPDVGFRRALWSCLGGLVFLAAGVLVSVLLRATVGRVRNLDWYDDVFLVGGSLMWCLAGSAAGAVFLGTGFWPGLGHALSLVGLVLSAFTLRHGLGSVGGMPDRRALWTAVAVLGTATAASTLLGFLPILGSPA